VDSEAADVAADLRRRALELTAPTREKIFAHVYSEPHPLMQEQAAWLEAYETGFEGGQA
jgi:pyruvate dehydrogenase E1 component alpha subunit